MVKKVKITEKELGEILKEMPTYWKNGVWTPKQVLVHSAPFTGITIFSISKNSRPKPTRQS